MSDVALSDVLWFVVLPYVALVLFVGVSIWRYRRRGFGFSSLSSQTLEDKVHYWGLVPFHVGILFVLTGHLLALLIPSSIKLWNGSPLRIAALEATGAAFAIAALFGLVLILYRRFNVRIKDRTSPMDWILYIVLLIQIVTGILVALKYPWGSMWFTGVATPYVWSLFKLQPNVDLIVALPGLIKMHIAMAWIFIGLIPFTRMVHMLVAPFPYLWRKPQMVRWWRPKERGW